MCAESESSIQLLLISGLYHCFRGDGTVSVDDFAAEKNALDYVEYDGKRD